MKDYARELEFYGFKIVIMLPSLFLLFYIFPNIDHYINYYIFIPIVLLPLTRFFLKGKLFSYVYPIFTLAFLLVILYTLVHDFGIFQNKLLNNLLIPLDYKTVISLMLALATLVLEEGITTRKIYRVVGSVVFSNLFLLEQYAAIYLMAHPQAIPLIKVQSFTYYQAFSAIAYLELVSIYSFVVNGYQYALPLATFALPYRELILGLFLVSIVALLLFLYRSDTRWNSERGVTLGYSVITGSVVGAVGIFLLDRLNLFYYGDAFLLFFVLAVTGIALYTSRSGYNERIE